MSINKVMLCGRLGKDPEVRYTQNNVAVASFSLATGDRRKDANGNWVDHTEWHNIVAWQKSAEFAQKYLKKGSLIFIDGKLQTRKWQDKEGKDRYSTEVVVQSFTFVGSKDGASRDNSTAESETAPQREMVDSLPTADSETAPVNSNVNTVASSPTFEDDDIPF